MPDPKAHARAAILIGAMTFDPAPLDLTRLQTVPAIRRVVPHIEPPLDLSVIPFRYPRRPKCRHARRRSSARE